MKSLNPMAIILIVIFTGLSLTGCMSAKLSDDDIDKIADRVTEKMYPKISADLHKEFAVLKGENTFTIKNPAAINRNTERGTTNKLAKTDTGTPGKNSLAPLQTGDMSFLPGPVNPLTATGKVDTKASSSPAVVKLNNHQLINRKQFWEIYNHMTKLFPVSSLKTANPEEILKHIVKVELMAAEATSQDMNKNSSFLKALHRPLTNAVITLLVSDIEQNDDPITDATLKEYYNKTKAIYRTRPYMSANVIEINGLEYTPRGKTKKLKASDLIAKLRENPKTFSDVAKEISLSPTASIGGKMDRIYPGDLSLKVNELLQKAEINKVLDPIKARNGNYVIFQVTARHEAATKPFELVKETINNTLLQKKRTNTIENLIELAGKSIDAEIYLDLLDKDGKPDDILARIEQVTITREAFEKIVKMQKGKKEDFATAKEQKGLLEGLYQQNLFSTFALKDPEYQKRHNVYLIFFQKEKLATFFLKTKLNKKFNVSNEQIAKHYEENTDRYKSKTPYVKTRHLIFNAKSSSEKDLEEAKSRANEAITKLNDGSTYKELASTVADGDSGKKEAAPTHWFTGGSTSLGKEYYELVSSLKKGTTAKNPVQIKNSFFVVKLEEKSEGTPFDLLKNKIANELSQAHQLEQYRLLLEEIEKRQIIKAYPEVIVSKKKISKETTSKESGSKEANSKEVTPKETKESK